METPRIIKSNFKNSEFDSFNKPNNPAPSIMGIDNKNENLAESLVEKPKNNANDIVRPDLDTPGIIAIAWEKPIINDEIRVCFLLFTLNFDEIIKTIPVKNSA